MSTITNLIDALESGDPVMALLAAIRVAAAGSALYLLALGILSTLAEHRPRLAARLPIRLPGLRPMSILVGAGLASGLQPGAAAGAQEAGEPPTTSPPSEMPVLELLEDEPPVMRVVREDRSATSTTTSSAVPTTLPPASPTIPDPPEPRPSPPQPRPNETATIPSSDRWHIEAGDHLWHVAESTLAQAWERPPSDNETARYWRAVVEANRDRLVEPDEPDLVYPGQDMLLPAIPPP